MDKLWKFFKDTRPPEERTRMRKSNKRSKSEESSRSTRQEDAGRAVRKQEKEVGDAIGMMENMSLSSNVERVGGFQKRPSPSPGAGAGRPSTWSYVPGPVPPFPQAVPFSPPSPGRLPTPPQFMPMPEPQTHGPRRESLTMQYARAELQNGIAPGFLTPQTAYSPPPAVPPRPISAPGGESRRPRPDVRVDVVSPPPASAPKIRRGNSEPSSPVSAGAKARKSGRRASESGGSDTDVETCGATTKAGKQCKNKVKTPAALDVLTPNSGSPVVRFCGVHQKEWLSNATGFYSKKEGTTDTWVEFDKYIPDYLQPDTKAALRVEMEKPRSQSDEPGYIYAFEIRDPDSPGVFYIKVGRSVNLSKRMNEWSKQCGSKEQALRGWWPGLVDANETSLLRGRIVAGEKGACCHRLERLIHIELADITLHQPHYRPRSDSDDELKSKSKTARMALPRGRCKDCGTMHKEIFSFQRPKGGKYVGKEWERLVKPVIERWGEFVELYV